MQSNAEERKKSSFKSLSEDLAVGPDETVAERLNGC